jgi:fluoride exporter
MKIVLIGLAGMAGTLGRYWVGAVVARRYEGRLPLDTLVVNAAGCFAIGFLFHLMRERLHVGETALAVVTVGLLGGFTTFSAYALQTFVLARDGRAGYAAANVLASNLLGLLMVWAGHALARALLPA